MVFCRLTTGCALNFVSDRHHYLQYMKFPRKSKDVEDRSTYRVQCNSNSNNISYSRSTESSTAAESFLSWLSIGQTTTQDNSYPVIVIAISSVAFITSFMTPCLMVESPRHRITWPETVSIYSSVCSTGVARICFWLLWVQQFWIVTYKLIFR